MSQVKSTEYLFLSAYIRAKENSLLGQKRLEQMVDAADFDEAAKVLTECGFPDLAGADDARLEEVFAQRRAAYLEELEKHCPEKQLVTAFRLKYDYHNAKVLVKGEQGGPETRQRLMSRCGRVGPEALETAWREDVWSGLPETFAAAVREARSALARTANPQLADIGLDKAYFAELLSIAGTLSTDFYAGYVRLSIDIANLRSAVRCLRGKMDEGLLRTALIPGGNVSADAAARRTYTDGVEAVFGAKPLDECAALGQKAVDGAPLAGFERACDNALNAYLAKAKQVPFGPEVAAAYLAALEAEIVSARMVLLGKRGGVPADTLRERVRDTYV